MSRSMASVVTVGALVLAALSACSSMPSESASSSSAPAREMAATASSSAGSPAPDASKEAGLRGVRFCIGSNLKSEMLVSAILPTGGGSVDLPPGSSGGCFTGTSDNMSEWEKWSHFGLGQAKWGAVDALFDSGEQFVILVRNPFLERPDVLLCSTQGKEKGVRDDCDTVYGMNTFSKGASATMDALGHVISVKRNPDSNDYIEFSMIVER